MKALTERILHYTLLILVTVFSAIVMWKLSARSQQRVSHTTSAPSALPAVAAPKAPVAVAPLQVKMCEIYSTYAGKIQPWETYVVGFEAPGRVQELGANESGKSLDEGDAVAAGQVLAVMDSRVLEARKNEAAAQVKQAESDLRRGERVRANNPSALSESELQQLVTDLAMARAQYEVAAKNLEDATLRSPVDATISKRNIKAGETVSANQVVFELVQNEQVLLVIDVPESRIRELQSRMREVKTHCRQPGDEEDSEAGVFRAHVHLEGTDRFGGAWPALEGKVYRIPEVADLRTGLFPVEIAISNPDKILRPGMVATADVVTARIPGYEVPEAAVLFRANRAFLFTVERERTEMEMLYWNLGSATLHRACQVDIPRWVDQGASIVIPSDSLTVDNVIVRGQFRLTDGQLVRIVEAQSVEPKVASSETSSRESTEN